VVTAERGIECWGFGLQNYDAPTDVGYASVAAGNDADCALRMDGTAICWGDLPAPPAGTFTHLAIEESACGVTSADGKILCWPSLSTLFPMAPIDTDGGFARVALGAAFMCATKTDESLQCWSAAMDYTADDAPDGTFLDVNASSSDVCAHETTGVVRCWGADNAQQDAAASGAAHRQVVAGKDAVCVLQADATVKCWGTGLAATGVPTGTEFVEIAIGDELGCGIEPSGDVTCWGMDPLPGKMKPDGLKGLVE